MGKSSAKTRVWIVTGFIFAWFMAVGGKLAWLQLADQSPPASRGRTRTLVTSRGSIYDRNGKNNPLAISVPARFFYLDPQQVDAAHKDALPGLAGRIAEVLDLPADDLLEKLRHPSSFRALGTLEENASFLAFTNKALFSGVYSRPASIRRYPQGARMAHVVGFVNQAGNNGPRGAYGVEQRHEERLRGVPGGYDTWVDAHNHEDFLRRSNYIPAVPGADVFLTLDNNIQALLEEGLRGALEKWDATRAWGVIQDARTGAILAMASAPAFDPNAPSAPWENQKPSFENLPLCFNYEPGSTMKVFTLAIALEEKVITPDTKIDVGQGVWFYRNARLEDKGLRGEVTLPVVMQKSSNIASAKIALMLADNTLSIRNGAHRLHETYLRLFGFGRKTGVDLPAEEKGILHPSEKWDALTATRVAIGHSISATAIQVATAYSAIANGGFLMKPHVVQRIVADNGEVLYEARPEVVARPVSAQTSAILRGLMAGVTRRGGTAPLASIADAGYTVAGKTGTSKMPVPGGYSGEDYWASFAGFCPSEKPVFTMIIVVEKPRGGHTGGEVAAPVFAAVARATARYLCIPSDIAGEVVEHITPFVFDPSPAVEDPGYWD